MAKVNYKIKLNFEKELKNKILIYNEGFISNGDWMIDTNYVDINNKEVQKYIDEKQKFVYSPNNKEFDFNATTKLENLIPKHLDEFDELIDTNMLIELGKKCFARVFYNQNKKYFTYINNKYFEYINKCNSITNDFRQSRKNGVITVHNLDVVALIMPIIPNYTFIEDKIYCYDVNVAKDLLFDGNVEPKEIIDKHKIN